MRTSLQVTVIVLSTAFLSCRLFSITSKITGCAVLRLKWNVRLTGSRPRLNYTVVAVSSLRWDRGKGDGNVVQFSRSSVLRWSIVGETPTTFSKPRIRMLTAVDRQDRSVGMEDNSRLGLAGNAEDGGRGLIRRIMRSTKGPVDWAVGWGARTRLWSMLSLDGNADRPMTSMLSVRRSDRLTGRWPPSAWRALSIRWPERLIGECRCALKENSLSSSNVSE